MNKTLLQKMKIRGWDLLHNCVAHPLLGLFPGETTDRFHDWTARYI